MAPVPIEDDALNAGMVCCFSLGGNIPQTRNTEYLIEDFNDGAAAASPSPSKQGPPRSVHFDDARKSPRCASPSPSKQGPTRSVRFEDARKSPRCVSALKSHPAAMDSRMDDDCDTATCSESAHHSRCPTPSPEEQLALEIGRNAHNYLEECFYTEASILCREKFNALPQICMEDFTVMSYLGKGNFSHVHHVVRADGMPSGDLGNGMAMKSLRPQVMEDVEQFEIGSEDLVHETALLANLRHRHIIKIHGRRAGPLEEGFLNGSYFIFLDKLVETLPDRMAEWKQSHIIRGPSVDQLEVAHAIADAMTFLHAKNIVFRDLKPDNVGFDMAGELKLFDFGFAIGLPAKDASNPAGYLYDRCGTCRYMAPEVGFSLGYNEGADVYSFGILLWEMCALKKPFAAIRCSEQFDRMVFMGGLRPTLSPRWSKRVSELMGSCWSATPSKRPRMVEVKSSLLSAIGNYFPSSGRNVR